MGACFARVRRAWKLEPRMLCGSPRSDERAAVPPGTPAAQRVHGPRAGSASGQGRAKRAGIPRLRGASGADARVRRTRRARSRRSRRETIVKKRTFLVELAPGRSRIVLEHRTAILELMGCGTRLCRVGGMDDHRLHAADP